MILHLSGEVNYDMMDQLVKSVNDLRKDDNIHIYFTSTGGLSDVAEAMIDFINKNKQLIGITFYGEIFSAGMYIFLRTECERWILKDTIGMFHFSWQEMAISEGGSPSGDYDSFIFREMKKSKEKTMQFLKTTCLTDTEINKIRKGKDVFFSHERMIEILNGTK